MAPEFFDADADVVHRHLGTSRSLSLQSAIDLSRKPREIDGSILVSELLAALDGSWWRKNDANLKGN
jgi:hypothetical protein